MLNLTHTAPAPLSRRASSFTTLLGVATAAWPFATRVQQSGTLRRIGDNGGRPITEEDHAKVKFISIRELYRHRRRRAGRPSRRAIERRGVIAQDRHPPHYAGHQGRAGADH